MQLYYTYIITFEALNEKKHVVGDTIDILTKPARLMIFKIVLIFANELLMTFAYTYILITINNNHNSILFRRNRLNTMV